MRPDLRSILEPLVLKGFGWEDSDKILDDNQRRSYSDAAKLILETSVWKNETNRLLDIWSKTAVVHAGSYDEILDMRAHLSAIRLLTERLEMIASWRKPDETPAEFPHDPI